MNVFTNAWRFLKSLPYANSHQLSMIWVPVAVALAVFLLVGDPFAVWFMFVTGLLQESMYCLGVVRHIKIGKINFSIWDLSATITRIREGDVVPNRDFEEKNLLYTCIGALIYIAIRLMMQ